jgi:hypothetical protein
VITWLAVLIGGLGIVSSGGFLIGRAAGRAESGPTVARLAGEIDAVERKLALEAAANDRLAALVPRSLMVRDNRFGEQRRPVLEINGVPVTAARVLECRDEVLRGRMAFAFHIEAGDWPVDELLAAQPDPPAPFATAGLVRLRHLVAEQAVFDRDTTFHPSRQPVS